MCVRKNMTIKKLPFWKFYFLKNLAKIIKQKIIKKYKIPVIKIKFTNISPNFQKFSLKSTNQKIFFQAKIPATYKYKNTKTEKMLEK